MGKSVSTPPVPDYTAIAKEQGRQNVIAAQQGSVLSNPNMYTPFGTQKVSYSEPTFDEAGYNTAYSDYNTKVDRNKFYDVSGGGGGDAGGSGTTETYFNNAAYREALRDAGAAPNRADYMKGGGVPTVTQTLTPEAQKTLEAQQRVQYALAGLGEQGIGNASNILSTPFQPTSTQINKEFADYGRAQNTLDTSNLAAMPINAGTTAQNLILQRLQPTMDQGDTSFKQALANQGLAPGTEAYNAAFRNREMSKNDLINQAALQGINLDMSARQQGYNELMGQAGLYNTALGQDYSQGLSRAQFGNTAQQQQLAQDLALRGQPLNEIIGLMSGSQIQLPQFAGYSASQVAPPPTFAGAQAGYNAQLGAANAQNAANSQLTQGLFQLGGAALLAPTGTFSDRRLKTNIKKVGMADNGLNVYSYNYVWGGPTQLGYMADEVEKVVPNAVGESQGFKTVNYEMI